VFTLLLINSFTYVKKWGTPSHDSPTGGPCNLKRLCELQLISMMCTGFSWAYGCSASADSYVSRHEEKDEISAADVTRWLDDDRGQLQQSASSVVNSDDASVPSKQQIAAADARSPGDKML